MAKALYREGKLFDIGDAIRDQLGVTTRFLPEQMAGAVLSISGGNASQSYTPNAPGDEVLVDEAHMTALGNAIRRKLGVTTLYLTEQMAAAIRSIAPEPVTLEGIYIYQAPDTVDYQSGDTLDLTGLIVYATYTDGTETEVTGNCTFDPPEGSVLIGGGGDESPVFIPVDIFYTEDGVTVNDSFSVGVTGTTTLDYSYNASMGALSFTETGPGGEYGDWAFDGAELWLNDGGGGGE